MEVESKNKRSLGKIILIVVIVAFLTTLLTGFLLYRFIFPKQIKPVELSKKESIVLQEKIDNFSGFKRQQQTIDNKDDKNNTTSESAKPMPYKEDATKREIFLTQREVNSLISKNTDLAQQLAVHLADDTLSANLVLPMDPSFPIVGGKNLKATAGLQLSYKDGNPVVILNGVSLWGVPIPNAWLGGLKNIDLIKEFGDSDGFWKKFADGVEGIQVVDGGIQIKLKE